MKSEKLKATEIFFIIILFIIMALFEASHMYTFNDQNVNVKYDFIDFDNDGISEFLIISGSGTVTAKPSYIYKNVEIIFICNGITAVEPQAFADLQSLKFLLMPSAAYSRKSDLPMQTELIFIDDDEYIEFVGLYM